MNFSTANDRASVFAKSEKSKRWNLIEQKSEKMASSRQTPLELQRYIWAVKSSELTQVDVVPSRRVGHWPVAPHEFTCGSASFVAKTPPQVEKLWFP